MDILFNKFLFPPPGLRFEFMVYEATTMDAGMSNAGLFSVPVTVICS